MIFDCDGVLVDTEAIYFEMNRRFILSQKTGGPADFDLSYYERFIGLAADLMWGELKETFALRESVSDLIANEKDLKAKALGAAPLVPLAGVSEFMADLAAAEIPMSVASSGRRDNVQLILKKLGFADKFKAVVTGEDIIRGKPAPDIFLKAAELCGVAATAAVVIEDSKNGTLGAKAAGMRCVGYRNPHSGNQDLSQADIRISSFLSPELRAFCGVKR